MRWSLLSLLIIGLTPVHADTLTEMVPLSLGGYFGGSPYFSDTSDSATVDVGQPLPDISAVRLHLVGSLSFGSETIPNPWPCDIDPLDCPFSVTEPLLAGFCTSFGSSSWEACVGSSGDFNVVVSFGGSPDAAWEFLEDGVANIYLEFWSEFPSSTVYSVSYASGTVSSATLIIDYDGGPEFVRGDCSADGLVDLADAIALLGYQFGGTFPVDCEDACDTNDDGALDLADAIYLLNALFVEGPPLAAPYPECGIDGTPEHVLGCDASPCGP